MLSVQREEASNSFASVQRSLNTLNIFRKCLEVFRKSSEFFGSRWNIFGNPGNKETKISRIFDSDIVGRYALI